MRKILKPKKESEKKDFFIIFQVDFFLLIRFKSKKKMRRQTILTIFIIMNEAFKVYCSIIPIL